MKKLKILNKINWMIALFLFLATIPFIYFNHIIFISNDEIIQPAKIASVLFVVNLVFVSMYIRITKKTTGTKKHKIFNWKLDGKNIFTKDAPSLFTKEYQSPKVTFFIIPFFGMVSGLALFLALVITVPGIYTKYEGEPEVRETIVLEKKIRGKRNNKYSIKLEGFDKSIDIRRIDFMNLEIGKKITVRGKNSKYGLLLEEFHRR